MFHFKVATFRIITTVETVSKLLISQVLGFFRDFIFSVKLSVSTKHACQSYI